MKETDRHQAITEKLTNCSFISVVDLQNLLHVSAATVRRDIEKLDELGVAKKVHGGIAIADGFVIHHGRQALPFVENIDIAVNEKRAIAKAAGKLVNDGSLIIIHGGSTCFQFGCSVADRNIRVFTNSQPLAAYLGEHGTCQLTVGGGDLHREPGIFYDSSGSGSSFYASQFFVGTLGINESGLLESHPLLVRFINEMSAMAHEIVALVDSRKFNESPPTVALDLQRISTLITDDGLTDNHAKILDDAGINYIVAEVER